MAGESRGWVNEWMALLEPTSPHGGCKVLALTEKPKLQLILLVFDKFSKTGVYLLIFFPQQIKQKKKLVRFLLNFADTL